jgi:hypothetical protein
MFAPSVPGAWTRTLSCVLVLAALVLALTTASVDSRRYGRNIYREIEPGVPPGESASDRFERGRLDRYRYRDRYRRHLPTNITALVPPDWRKDPADPNWRGHRYVSPTGDASIAFYGKPVVEGSRDQYLKGLLVVADEDITYMRRERDRMVAFGSKGERSERHFYRKVILACGGRQWRHIALEFPTEARRDFERFIDRLSKVADGTAENGCETTKPVPLAGVTLSADEMRCVYDRVPKWAKTNLRLRLALGAEIPRDTKLFIFPGETIACNSKLGNLRYIVVEEDVVIVDPGAYSIVQTISP